MSLFPDLFPDPTEQLLPKARDLTDMPLFPYRVYSDVGLLPDRLDGTLMLIRYVRERLYLLDKSRKVYPPISDLKKKDTGSLIKWECSTVDYVLNTLHLCDLIYSVISRPEVSWGEIQLCPRLTLFYNTFKEYRLIGTDRPVDEGSYIYDVTLALKTYQDRRRLTAHQHEQNAYFQRFNRQASGTKRGLFCHRRRGYEHTEVFGLGYKQHHRLSIDDLKEHRLSILRGLGIHTLVGNRPRPENEFKGGWIIRLTYTPDLGLYWSVLISTWDQYTSHFYTAGAIRHWHQQDANRISLVPKYPLNTRREAIDFVMRQITNERVINPALPPAFHRLYRSA